MKKILLFLTATLLATLAGCTTDRDPVIEPEEQRGPISFTLNVPQLKTRAANTDFTISRIDLLICDAEERVLQKAATVHDGAGKYTAQVIYSGDPRIVHLIANYDWAEWDGNLIGKDAREVLAGISTNQFTAWKRIELPGGITMQQPFGTDPIELICNMAKFTLTVESGLTDVSFAIYNYDRGTIATFNPRAAGDGHAFAEDVITVPHDVQLAVPTDTDFKPMTGGAFFTFERENSTAGVNYSCMIIKGTYNGTVTYYKIDFVGGTPEVRQNILRNHSYHITVAGISNIGHPDIASAIAAAADNTNFSLDPSLEIYPSITDGTRKLEVDKNLIVITDNSQSANFTATYSVNNGGTWTEDNSKLGTPTIEPVSGYEAAVTNVTINTTTGEVTVTKNPLPASGELRSKIKIPVDYWDSGIHVQLYRSVIVLVRPAYVMTATASTVPATQNAVMTVTLTLPDNFPTRLLPLEVRFKTDNFYPHGDNPMRYDYDGGPVYIYTLPDAYTPGTPINNIKFKSNKAASAETIVVSAPYCAPVNMAVTN